MSARAIAIVCVASCGGDRSTALDATPLDAPVDTVMADAGRPTLISQTGLYLPGTHDAAPGHELFEPTHALWSDGAKKRRWIVLPSKIEVGDPDHWQFPVGTRFFKEFAAPDGTLLETRLIERVAATGDDEVDYWLGAFVWRADGTDAELAPDGAENVNGTLHDVPSQLRCRTCHGGEPGLGLGFSAIQLSGAGTGVRLADLVASDRLSTAIAEAPTPGDATTAAALGYLHANCGHCHNPGGSAWPDANMDLRLYVAHTTPAQTTAYTTAVNVPLFRYSHPGITLRIAPGDASTSAVAFRAHQRGSLDQMPPIATEFVDATGAAIIDTWIDSLEP